MGFREAGFDAPGPRPDLTLAEASPLGVAMAERDRGALAMVDDAVRQRRLRLAYQPVKLAKNPTDAIFYEGLIRILDPRGQAIPARDFIGAVEGAELGREIDCAALAMGADALRGQPNLRLSVNISARSLGYPKFLRILRGALAQTPGLAERLILEISESSAISLPEIVAAFMQELRPAGVTFALDGFGAGITCLRHFRDFRFDIVKIDGQFTRNIANNPGNQMLMAALLGLARQFDTLAVAQSVEHAAEADWLAALGVDFVQGFHIGLPTTTPAL